MPNPILNTLLLAVALASQTLVADPEPSTVQADEVKRSGSASTVTGKGSGMGRAYQENVPGPGKGGPENRSQGAAANPDPKVGSREGQDGAGMGTGYPGYRGHGSDEHPGHKQHGLPPRGS